MDDTKKTLRTEMRKRLKMMSVQDRASASANICSYILAMDAVRTAGAIGMYAAMASEPDLAPAAKTLLERPCVVAYPRHNNAADRYEMVPVQDIKNDFVAGAYGVSEPRQKLPALDADTARNLVWFVPGLAFDRGGNRLGRGGGYYDRLLEETNYIRIGVSFDSQLVSSVPVMDHDVRMDFVVTECGVCECAMKEPV